MNNPITEDKMQQTLSGEVVEVASIECEKSGVCSNDAEYVVDALSYILGKEMAVKCCETCKDEFAEWTPPRKVRELAKHEKVKHGN